MTTTWSAILCTVGRSTELRACLASLAIQDCPTLEVVIVDQNRDQRAREVLQEFSESLNVTYLKSTPGLSRARNVGLSRASGQLISFPDDDCVYPPGLVGRVGEYFRVHPEVDWLSGRSAGLDGEWYGNFDRRPGRIDKLNVWRRTCSYTMF